VPAPRSAVGDSYDNALAESFHGIYKTELIRRQGPWRNADHVELATLAYVEWFNHRRLHSELDHSPPAEHEARYYARPRGATNTPNTHPDLTRKTGPFSAGRQRRSAVARQDRFMPLNHRWQVDEVGPSPRNVSGPKSRAIEPAPQTSLFCDARCSSRFPKPRLCWQSAEARSTNSSGPDSSHPSTSAEASSRA
jgi:hypothetical protein